MTTERTDYEEVRQGGAPADEHGGIPAVADGLSVAHSDHNGNGALPGLTPVEANRLGTPSEKGTGVSEAPARATIATHYRLTSSLRSGRLVQTWRALDVREGSEVVIKTAPLGAISSGAWMRLEHDVETLARLEAPSFAAPIHVSEQDGIGYLVMPFVPGVSLEERLRERTLTADETLAVAAAVLRALQEAHGGGVLHRNIKPENLIIKGTGARLQEAVLIDFGLGRGSMMEASRHDELLRTAR
ncbi:MAG: protein kinase, partial [Actinomycetota bacterium]|nr:protein kinase [Actinomycetota bacterium]